MTVKLPDCHVPTKSAWETARKNAGGKAGLSKANLTKNLEAFHVALGKSKSSGDLGPINIAIHNLSVAAKTYLEDIKKLKTYKNLETAVTTSITTPLNNFVHAIEAAAKSANTEINRVEHEIQNRIDMVKRTTTECDKKVAGMDQELVALSSKYGGGIPAKDAPMLTKMVKEMGGILVGYKNAIEELNKALVEVVSDNLKDHRPLVEKFNGELGTAKGQIKTSNSAINVASARVKEMISHLQNKVIPEKK